MYILFRICLCISEMYPHCIVWEKSYAYCNFTDVGSTLEMVSVHCTHTLLSSTHKLIRLQLVLGLSLFCYLCIVYSRWQHREYEHICCLVLKYSAAKFKIRHGIGLSFERCFYRSNMHFVISLSRIFCAMKIRLIYRLDSCLSLCLRLHYY